MTKKDLLKVFLVVLAAEAVCHWPVGNENSLVKLRNKLHQDREVREFANMLKHPNERNTK